MEAAVGYLAQIAVRGFLLIWFHLLFSTVDSIYRFMIEARRNNEWDEEREIADKLAIDRAQRHIFLCCDQTKPKCCGRKRSLKAWDYLKKRLKELGLVDRGGVQRRRDPAGAQ